MNSRIFAIALLFIFAAVGAHAVVSFTNTTTYISMNPSTKIAGVFTDSSSRYNGTIMNSASYVNFTYLGKTFYGLNVSGDTTRYLRVNLSSTNTLQFGENSTSSSTSMYVWDTMFANDGIDRYLLKSGAGTGNMIWMLQQGTAGIFRYELVNSTGTSSFPQTTFTPRVGVPTLYVLTVNSSYTFAPYVCEYGGSAVAYSTTTVTGSKLRSSSQDAILVGSNGNSPVNGTIHGFGVINQTLSLIQIQQLCELGPNANEDNISLVINYTTAIGTVKATDGNNWHTGFLLSNVTVQYNNFSARLDVNNDTAEDTQITQANAANMQLLALNFTSPGGTMRAEMSLESAYNSSGSLKACSNSDYASTCMRIAMNAWAWVNNRHVRWQMTFMPDFMANNTNSSVCTSNRTCPPLSYPQWGSLVKNYSEMICGPFVFADGSGVCEFEVWNEHDLQVFWLNALSSRTGSVFRNFTKSLHTTAWDAIKNSSYAHIRNADIWMSPAADVNDSTATSVRRNTMADLHAAGYDGFKVGFHFYHIAWNNFGRPGQVLEYAVNLVLSDCVTYYVPCTELAIDEWGTYNSTDQSSSLDSYGWKSNQVNIADMLHYMWNQQNVTMENNFYQAALWGYYNSNSSEYPRLMSTVQHPQLGGQTLLSPYDPLWRFTQYHRNGSSLYNCTTNDYYVDCTQTKNGVNFSITLTNMGDLNRSAINVTLVSASPPNLTNVKTGAVFNVSGSNVIITDLQAKTSNTYIFNSSDTTPPSLTIAAPLNGTNLTSATVNITVNVTDSIGVTQLIMYNGTANVTLYNSTAVTSINYTGNTTLPEGSNTLTFYAIDSSNNVARGNVTFTIDTTAPSTSVSGLSGVYQYSDTLNFTNTASDTALSTCFYSIVSSTTQLAEIGNTTITCNSTTGFSVSPSDSYTLFFYANDTFGNMGTSTATFTVSSPPTSGGGGGGGGGSSSSTTNTSINQTTSKTSDNEKQGSIESTIKENIPYLENIETPVLYFALVVSAVIVLLGIVALVKVAT